MADMFNIIKMLLNGIPVTVVEESTTKNGDGYTFAGYFNKNTALFFCIDVSVIKESQ